MDLDEIHTSGYHGVTRGTRFDTGLGLIEFKVTVGP